jgi:hypothetical protein
MLNAITPDRGGQVNLPDKIYTKKEVERAKDTAQIVGWLQGAGVVVGGLVLWNLLGWIPLLVVVVAVGWLMLKLLGGKKQDDEET